MTSLSSLARFGAGSAGRVRARRCRSRRRSRAGSPRRRGRRGGSPARRPRAEQHAAPAMAPKSTALITVPLSARACACRAPRASRARPRPRARGGVEAAVGHLHLLDRGVDAVGRGDQRGALGAHEPFSIARPGLDELRSDHHVDVARLGVSESTGSFPFRAFLATKISR